MSNDNITLEILVPTYQRAAVLLQNMEVLAALILMEGKGGSRSEFATMPPVRILSNR